MPILCMICREVLKSTDDIYSTNCGHIFHFVCMHEFQRRSSCPECQHFKPTSFKMYLNFGECKDQKLSNSWKDDSKILELHKQIEDNKNNYVDLQKKYLVSQNLVRKLEERIRKADNGNSQKIGILSDLEDRLKTLEELNEFLAIDNECKSEALALKAQEVKRLKIKKADTTASVLNKKINRVEEKLKSHEEIENYPNFSKEKIELQEHIDLIDLSELETIASKDAFRSPTENVNKKQAGALILIKSEKKLSQNQLATEKLTESIIKLSTDNSSELQHNNKQDPKNDVLEDNVHAECLKAHNGEINHVANKTSELQITKIANVKLVVKKFGERCLKFSYLFIFIFLISSVTTVN